MTQTASYEKQPILVVEDDAQLQMALSSTLGGQGYSVSVVNDGYQGMEWLQRNGACLVLADINLPGKSGMDLLRDIRMAGNQVPRRHDVRLWFRGNGRRGWKIRRDGIPAKTLFFGKTRRGDRPN